MKTCRIVRQRIEGNERLVIQHRLAYIWFDAISCSSLTQAIDYIKRYETGAVLLTVCQLEELEIKDLTFIELLI